MGALHPGHLSLVQRARREVDRVVVSLFVNPLQFDNPAELRAYPRDRRGDLERLRGVATDLCFAPRRRDLFPASFATTVCVSRGTRLWEGAARPGHFDGVATVVARLLSLAGLCRAYFGEKDAQQLQLVRRLVLDLGLPAHVVACATIREADGLPWSSRNRTLSSSERAAAACLPRALAEVLWAHRRGEDHADRLARRAAQVISGEPLAVLDYAALVDPVSFEPVVRTAPGTRVILAARIGPVRLIDGARLSDRALLRRTRSWEVRPPARSRNRGRLPGWPR